MMQKIFLLLLAGTLLPHGLLASDVIVGEAGKEDHGNLRGIDEESSRELLCTPFEVTIELRNSDDAPLANEPIQSINLFKPNSGGQTFSSLTTDTSGLVKVTPAASPNVNLAGIDVTVRYKDTIAKKQNVDLSACTPVPFQTSKAKVRVLKANGGGRSGVAVSYSTFNTGGGPVGTTNNQGYAETELFPDNTKFTASYLKTSAESPAYVNISVGGTDDIDYTFQLTNIVVTASECGNEPYQKPVGGVEVKYFVANSGGGTVGTTNANGRVSTELFPGTMDFTATINRTSKKETGVIIGSGTDYKPDVEFYPKKMNFGYTEGTLSFFQSNIGSTTVVDGTYLFPGDYDWKFTPTGGAAQGPFKVKVSECEA